ncbi:MAG TPA: glycoside hydrolase family 15 protein [Candidatus Saccharimonadales bacterium]|nr:glycoside hydrolase family 15 protein [Candidatus Saccharimonadales bacterium]
MSTAHEHPRTSTRLEDYVLIGDTHTAALVGIDGSIDWLCVPRFDSPACFAALLGDARNGRWKIAPAGGVRRTEQRYREGTLVAETEFETEDGTIRLTDCMTIRRRHCQVVRVVEGVRGRVPMEMELIARFDYGSVVPWARRVDGVLQLIAGPDQLRLHSAVETHGENLTTKATFVVAEGDRVPFMLEWQPSFVAPLPAIDILAAVDETAAWWRRWTARFAGKGDWQEAVLRSLITLKALTYAPTGGIVAAPTTSLPEQIGGVRNWDYRFCWLRDATFTLDALVLAGYDKEAAAWRDWLLRAVAGDPSALQILYGPAGERRIDEWAVSWLPGYEGSAPVRIGNAASKQFQLDVYGEVIDSLYLARRLDLQGEDFAWQLETHLLDFLEGAWKRPDEGIWEVRGPRQDFTHSKVMAWVAFDRAVKTVERFHVPGPVDRWRSVAKAIHDEVCARGFDADLNSFVQVYGARRTDASLLMIPTVGFLPVDDPRVIGTVAAIERELLGDGYVRRYSTETTEDGLPSGEGTFLACSFWLADVYALMGRLDDCRRMMERLLAVRSRTGLLAEEYDVGRQRMVGNYPQAISHVGLIRTALTWRDAEKATRRHLA